MAATSAQSDAQIYDRIKASIPPGYGVLPVLGSLLHDVWQDEGTRTGMSFPTRGECEDLVLDNHSVRHWALKGWSARSFYGLRGYLASWRGMQFAVADVLEVIKDFKGKINEAIGDLANGRVEFDSWRPPSKTSPDYATFLEDLRLPCLTGQSDSPNLLIHELGAYVERSDVVKAVVDNIFGESLTDVCNASGVGKTRTLLEGLTSHWGFYFTMAKGSKGVGSDDWHEAVKGLATTPGFQTHVLNVSTLGKESQVAQLNENHQFVGRRLDAILLARLEIFRCFLSHIPSSASPADAAVYRQRWLMLQLDPKILPGHREMDIFLHLSRAILEKCDSYFAEPPLSPLVRNGLIAVTSGGDPTSPYPTDPSHSTGPFYIVMDEAQAVANLYRDAFRSATRKGLREPERRSLFRAILMNLVERVQKTPVVVLPTGTNVCQADLNDSTISASQRFEHNTRSVHYTGGIETFEDLLAYALRYLPPRFLDNVSGRRLLRRMFVWLKGRYRFIAQYIFFLLRNGLRSPHRVLNSFIYAYTDGYEATDASDLVNDEPKYALKSIQKSIKPSDLVNLDTLGEAERTHLISVIRPMVFSYVLRSACDMYVGENDAPLLVEAGFGRYASEDALKEGNASDEDGSASEDDVTPNAGQEATVNEPLMILLLASRLDRNINSSSYDYFARYVDKNVVKTASDGWENYLAHSLVRIFSCNPKPRLSSIFDIVGGQADEYEELMKCRAGLVGVVRAGNNHVICPVQYVRQPNSPHPTCARQPSVCLGRSAGSNDISDEDAGTSDDLKYERTMKWLETTPTPLLFPDTNMGPDLVAILQLDDGHLLWLFLQAKLLKPTYTERKYSVKPESAKAAIWSLVPENLFVSRNAPKVTTAMSEKRARACAALDGLPNRTDLAGDHSVLRVVAIYPGELDLNEVYAKMPDEDTGNPLAQVDFRFFQEVVDEFHPTYIMKSIAHGKKRAAKRSSGSSKAPKVPKEEPLGRRLREAIAMRSPPPRDKGKDCSTTKGRGAIQPKKEKIAGVKGRQDSEGEQEQKGSQAPGENRSTQEEQQPQSAALPALPLVATALRDDDLDLSVGTTGSGYAPSAPFADPNPVAAEHDAGSLDAGDVFASDFLIGRQSVPGIWDDAGGIDALDSLSDASYGFDAFDPDAEFVDEPPDTASHFSDVPQPVADLSGSILLGVATPIAPTHDLYSSDAAGSAESLSYPSMTPPVLHRHSYSDSAIATSSAQPSGDIDRIPTPVMYPLPQRTPKRDAGQFDPDSDEDNSSAASVQSLSKKPRRLT
ncbi:hypothetical protein K525DRAFT_268745 [Schizophyllum commune Loenen D]|nr:hypothetical protein K525DRAFT_268745 [Schizophyllum commune Loenen D]